MLTTLQPTIITSTTTITKEFYGFKSHQRKRAKAFFVQRNQFIKDYSQGLVTNCITFVTETLAVILIQKITRGYILRRWHPLPYVVKWTPQLAKRRHAIETYRRQWARSKYMPKGGWPGKKEYFGYEL